MNNKFPTYEELKEELKKLETLQQRQKHLYSRYSRNNWIEMSSNHKRRVRVRKIRINEILFMIKCIKDSRKLYGELQSYKDKAYIV